MTALRTVAGLCHRVRCHRSVAGAGTRQTVVGQLNRLAGSGRRSSTCRALSAVMRQSAGHRPLGEPGELAADPPAEPRPVVLGRRHDSTPSLDRRWARLRYAALRWLLAGRWLLKKPFRVR